MTGLSPTRVIGGRYVVLGAIDTAADGPVWRAADRVTGNEVAVAQLCLPADQDERRHAREQVLRAARAAGRLEQAGLVAIHDVVTDGEVDHVVTELVDAPTLGERVATGGPLVEPAASALARQLAAALQAVHAAGVVHRDVGPHTVLLAPDGTARLARAGVAEAVDPRRATRGPAFLAPELRAGGPATAESDLWACGAVLHLAVLGRPPADDSVPVLGGGALADVVTGLLRPDAHERPTARQVVAALDAARELAGIESGRGHRWWWALSGALLGVLAGSVLGFALSGPRLPTFTYGPGGDVRPAGALTGACLSTGPARDATPTAVDCATPHAAEVVATLDPFGDGAAAHPGRDGLVRFAAGACGPAFEAVVEPSRREGLQLVGLVPTEAAFAAGERGVHCVVRAADGSALTGSRVG
ncbi:protein kinase domain-containing protein [Pseudonocardia zijingensis]|uniref:protein kinase domain-containing protein n=1 Tax=Pseudonocardia zijingensis TaxID=153376 RepID=UPI0031DF1B28